MEEPKLSPAEKALLLQAIAAVLTANKVVGVYQTLEREALNKAVEIISSIEV